MLPPPPPLSQTNCLLSKTVTWENILFVSTSTQSCASQFILNLEAVWRTTDMGTESQWVTPRLPALHGSTPTQHHLPLPNLYYTILTVLFQTASIGGYRMTMPFLKISPILGLIVQLHRCLISCPEIEIKIPPDVEARCLVPPGHRSNCIATYNMFGSFPPVHWSARNIIWP